MKRVEIMLIKDLEPFLKIFVTAPSRPQAKETAKVHAQSAGMYDKLDEKQKIEFDRLCNYLWMAAKQNREDTQKKVLQNPTNLRKWIWDTRPDAKYNHKELLTGMAHEYDEHIPIMPIAKKIAKDHLDEIPNYYTLLADMENKAKIKSNPENKIDSERKYIESLRLKEKTEKKEPPTLDYSTFNPPRLYQQKPPAVFAKNPSEKLVKGTKDLNIYETELEYPMGFASNKEVKSIRRIDKLRAPEQKEAGFHVDRDKKNPTMSKQHVRKINVAWKKARVIQSVTFSNYTTPATAKKWLKKHGLKYGDMDTKTNTIRFRQHDPKLFEKFSSKKLGGDKYDYVILTLGTLKKQFKGHYNVYEHGLKWENGFIHLDIFSHNEWGMDTKRAVELRTKKKS